MELYTFENSREQNRTAENNTVSVVISKSILVRQSDSQFKKGIHNSKVTISVCFSTTLSRLNRSTDFYEITCGDI